MKKINYIFAHGKILLIVFIFAIIFVSCSIFNVVQQLNSQKNGIEILLIDTSINLGTNKILENEIREKTGVKFVGVGSITSKEAQDYVKTVRNFQLHNYFKQMTDSKNSEAIFVTETLLGEVLKMDNLVPINTDGEYPQICYIDNVLYALPLTNVKFTENENTLFSVDENCYAVLVKGDHTEIVEQYLISITKEAE